jgi:PST family polysaccharide transporter
MKDKSCKGRFEMANEKKGLLRGALFLTIAGIVSKILSAGYRIPLQNLTGDIGFYIYQQVYPLLGIGLVLALYGFPSAVSHVTAEIKRKKQPLSRRHFYMPVLLILTSIIGVLAILLFIFAEQLAFTIGDVKLTNAYRLVAFSLLMIPFVSLLRGVSQGNLNMKPTAYSQVGEQIIRVAVIIIVAMYVGASQSNLYRIGEGAAVASILGAITAFIILLLLRPKDRNNSSPSLRIPWRFYVKTIVLFGFVASLNHMVLLLFQLADAFTLIPALEAYGHGEREAMGEKGILDRGQPLIQLGMVLGSSFALAMIPSISQQRLKEKPQEFYQSVRSSLKVSLYLAVGASAGLIAIMPEANILLFQDTKGTSDLRILVLSIALSAMAITALTILQGLRLIKRTALFILIAVAVKWIGNSYLVPQAGITASAISTVLGLTVLLMLAFAELRRKLPKLQLARNIKWPVLLLATAGMLLYILIIDGFAPEELSRFGALLYVCFIASTGACIYLIILFRGRTFTKEEISMLPFSNIWLRFYKERKS